ncbi:MULTISPECIES: sensor histidine kinase [unclassified Arcicella]|uniref:sensor histidine kinase n=1 Tax=unclassified Arcicella TaxID=2644986 RepID=UPI00286426C2|nr:MULTISPECIES: sensor histidine kinase [unclassified Arcicella]MDR6563612.1 signal transduction histidine kinase [Arcicella sp. BE51]MDR6814250.1 signal transduction histidine kinase [Arcicella sp. BE140]MDR6825511.1 signal transduction histidine kinase [Arcicella sp. BE139]
MQENLHFDISTSVIKQLGEQLISDEVTAIMELIKNSYDAEADWVKIDIDVNNCLTNDFHFNDVKGYILLEDNGEGMSLSDISSRWLVISFSAKRDQKESGTYNEGKRIPLGDKGLGRLSTQRIGKQIEIVTGVADEDIYHSLAYNWDDFDGTRKLSDVQVVYRTFPKKVGLKGTKVAITSLNNPTVWKGEAFDVFRSELSKMIFPVKENRPFNVRLSVAGQKVDLDSLNEQLRKQAIGEYKLRYDGKKLNIEILLKLNKLRGNDSSFYEKTIISDNGKAFFEFLTDKQRNKREFLDKVQTEYLGQLNNGYFFKYKTEYHFEKIANNSVISGDILILANPGIFDGEILEYDIRGDVDLNEEEYFDSVGEYKRLVKNQVGVRIFRDGFGIKPYGLNNNDWLQLSTGQTSGASFYGLRPGNIIGYISISNKDNLSLTEKTDREGFVESPYSQNFFLITKKFVSEINLVLERAKRALNTYKSVLADSKGTFQGSTTKAIEGVNAVAEQSKNTLPIIEELQTDLSSISKEVKQNIDSPLFNNQNTTSADLKVVSFLHKAENTLMQVEKAIKSSAELDNNADFIAPQINLLKRQLHDFSELAGLGLTAEAWSHEILNMLERISSQTNDIEKRLKMLKNIDSVIYIYIEYVKSFVQNLRIQVNHFSPSLRYNREKKQEIKLSEFIDESKTFFVSKFTKINGEIKVSISEDFKVKANKGKLTQVFDNILLNSEYWLRKKQLSDKSFLPIVFIEVDSHLIKIWDNGSGIDETIAESIFQPFTTSKPVGEGRGLGLYIVEQIIESMGGEITLLHKRNTENRRYIFQINLESAKVNP